MRCGAEHDERRTRETNPGPGRSPNTRLIRVGGIVPKHPDSGQVQVATLLTLGPHVLPIASVFGAEISALLSRKASSWRAEFWDDPKYGTSKRAKRSHG